MGSEFGPRVTSLQNEKQSSLHGIWALKKKWFVCLFGTNKNVYPSLPVELVVENGTREEAGKDVVVTGAEIKQKQKNLR